MKLHISNKTKYSGRELRQVTKSVIMEFNRSRGLHMDGFRVTFRHKERETKYSEPSSLTGLVGWNGYAIHGTNCIVIYLRKDGLSSPSGVAEVIAHELYHCAGFSHNRMGCGSHGTPKLQVAVPNSFSQLAGPKIHRVTDQDKIAKLEASAGCHIFYRWR